VSRLLRDEASPVRVSEKTRRRVLAAVRELGYRPNRAAQSLMTNRMRIIGLCLPGYFPPDTLDSSISDMNVTGAGMLIHGVQSVITERGYDLHLLQRQEYRGRNAPDPISASIDLLDGIIYVTPVPSFDWYTPILDEGVPLVMVGPNPSDRSVTYVCADNEGEVYRLVRTLLLKGHRRIGFLLPEAQHPLSPLRIKGIERAYAEEGVKVSRSCINYSAFGQKATERAVVRLLEERPTAVLVTRPDAAFVLMKEMTRQGIACPGEMEVLVYGDDFAFRVMKPSLSALDLCAGRMAAAAAKALLDEIEECAVPGRVIRAETEFRERESCALAQFGRIELPSWPEAAHGKEASVTTK